MIQLRKYIALLRGVNVGSNNKIVMSELKIAFENHVFQNVKTYINSGNIIFVSDCLDVETLWKKCEALTSDTFNLAIRVTVISTDALTDAITNAPEWWDKDTDSKHNAIFVIPPAIAESLACEVGEINPEYEKADYYGNVIFWSAPIKTFSRTRWSKIIGTQAYDCVTVRNSNTAKKLLELTK